MSIKNFLFSAMLFTISTLSYAQIKETDSVQIVALDEIEIIATRAAKHTPIAFKNITNKDLSKLNTGKDIPAILTMTPSVMATSDTGMGIGYSSIRIRGTDPSRINVTANGIPMNDAESHELYWVNTPDFISSLEDIQIQRGAGTSTNGAGAFGGSINMKTKTSPRKSYAEIAGSYGSFNTHKESVKIGTGLIKNHFSFDARLSNINSDGYRDRASSDLKSYYLQANYFNRNSSYKFITFGGKEITYHAWDGISKEDLKNRRKYNPNGVIKLNGNVVGYYNDQKDHYKQTNYQFIADHHLSPNWRLNWALHRTNGYGFYQEYKNNQTLEQYGIAPYSDKEELFTKQNLIRKKIVDSHFSGVVTSLGYSKDRVNLTLGSAMNYYKNHHYGQVLWIKNYIGELDPSQQYYSNTGRKIDGNIYLKGNYNITNKLNLYVDLQYRYIKYKLAGSSDRWNWSASPGHLQKLSLNESFNFINPKTGLTWMLNNQNKIFASFSIAQREPKRGDYTDGLFNKKPQSETLYDYEIGYNLNLKRANLTINLYYMDYKDQLVLTGKLNDIGRAVAENVPNSYRMGIELAASSKITDWLTWDINATWSKNRIKNYVTYIVDRDYQEHKIEWGTTPISMSPSLMGSSMLNVELGKFNLALQSQFSTRQYLDNLGLKENSLNPFLVNHLHLAYKFKLKKINSLNIGASVYNLFNTKYETNGYARTSINQNNELNFDPRFYPMAGTNILLHTTITF